MILELRSGSGRSNEDGESTKGIPAGGRSGSSNSGRDIKDWKAGKGATK